MEEQDTLAIIIGKNITRLRKLFGMTQLELAEKLNYSDKSVSKWEQGNGIPDVRILVQLAELFNVSVDDLVREHKEKPVVPKRERKIRRIVITLLSVGVCWLVAVACFVLIGVVWNAKQEAWREGAWLAFVYAVPASAVVVTVFSSIWHWKWTRVAAVSVLIWTLLACIYLTLWVCQVYDMWLIFLIGVPLQVLALIYFLWRKKAKLKE